jgi:hypothetical protein
MSDDRTNRLAGPGDEVRRRNLLAAACTVGATVLAGCSGGGGSTPTATPTPDQGAGSCPSGAVSYSRRELATNGEGPPVSVAVPQGSFISVVTTSNRLSLSIGDGSTVGVTGSHRPDRTIDSAVDELTSRPDTTVVTDQYDIPSGAAVVRGVAGVKRTTYVLLPLSTGFLQITVLTFGLDGWCPSVLSAIETRIIESLRVA